MRKVWPAAAMLLLTAALAGCESGSSAAGDRGKSGTAASTTAVYGSTAEPKLLWDPSESHSNEVVVLNNIYETLLRYDAAGDTVTPVLAESYGKSGDGLTWTFRLKSGVKFHSGKTMTASDVKRSFERTIALGKGAAYILDPIASIAAPDDRTVVFRLKYAAALDLVVSAPYAAFIFNADALDRYGADYFAEGHEDGTGPYKLGSWSPGESVVLDKFGDYREGWVGPHYGRVEFRTVSDPDRKAKMIEGGELTYVDIMPAQQLNALKGNPRVRIVATPSYQNLIAFLNTRSPKLSDPSVRKALSLAFPYEQVARDIMNGTASPANGPLPKGLWGHDDHLPAPSFDPDGAKALLAKAGAKGLALTLTYTQGDSNQQRIAELYARSLASLGVELILEPMTWEEQWRMAKSADASARQDLLMMYWWPDYPSPHGFLYSLFHSETDVNYNLSYYSNPSFDELIDDAAEKAGSSRELAARMYAEAQELLNRDYPAIWIYDAQYVRAIDAGMQGFADNPAYPNVVFWYDVRP